MNRSPLRVVLVVDLCLGNCDPASYSMFYLHVTSISTRGLVGCKALSNIRPPSLLYKQQPQDLLVKHGIMHTDSMNSKHWKNFIPVERASFGGIKLNQVLLYLKSYITSHPVEISLPAVAYIPDCIPSGRCTQTLTPCIFNRQDTLDNLYGLNKRRRWVCVSLSECRSECDSCFNKNFCTRCRAGFYLHLGKCQENCPEGLVRSDTHRECVPSEY